MKTLEEEIKYYKNNGINLFYNSEGNDQAYKLFVRHVGYAAALGYGKIKNEVLLLEKDIYIVDFDLKLIDLFLSGTEIKVISLKGLD